MRVFRLSLALSALAVSLACGGSPSGPSDVTATAPAVSAGSGSRVTSQTLDGSFRIRPEPDASGLVVLDAGQKLVVNANDDRAANPRSNLHLIVNWGDGPNERIGCGPCRLEHAYRIGGLYEMEATIDDGVTTTSRRFRVKVVGSLILFDAEPSRIAPGESTTLVWNADGASSVTVDGVGVPVSGSSTVTPATTTTYTLRATGPSGTETARVTVVVSWIRAFFFSPTTIAVGERTIFTFEPAPGFTTFTPFGACPVAFPVSVTPTPSGGIIFELEGVFPGECTIGATLSGGGVTSTETATLVVQ